MTEATHTDIWMSPARPSASTFPVMMANGAAEVSSTSTMRFSFSSDTVCSRMVP